MNDLQKSEELLDKKLVELLVARESHFSGPLDAERRPITAADGEIIFLKTQIEELQERMLLTHKRAVYWQDLYNRDVEGLNNEGDAIGGEPARGMRYYIEYFRKENERLRSLLPPEPSVDPQAQAWCGK